MINRLDDYRLIQKLAPQNGGVFSLSDLKSLFNESHPVPLYRRINALCRVSALMRFRRQFYVAEDFNPEVLTQRIVPEAYISFGNALARHLLIGSVPSKTVSAVKTGRNRIFRGAWGTIAFFGIAPELMFGFTLENGVRYATPEKAFLDTLYFYQKGRIFSFNVYSDIDFSRLDKKLVLRWLKKYRNPKFVSFVKGVITEPDHLG
jgi:hypothetical protein